MARPKIPAAVLADRGVPITLVGDLPVTICYNFRSLMVLEERHGSIGKALEVIQKGAEGAAFTSLAGILAAGLLHEHEPHDPEQGQNGRSLGDAEVLADYLDPTRLGTYSEAMGEAFKKAFPSAGGAAADPQVPAIETPASPGVSGTTSPSSASGSPMPSSGA